MQMQSMQLKPIALKSQIFFMPKVSPKFMISNRFFYCFFKIFSDFCISMTPTENQHCNRQNCFTGSEPCEFGDIEIFQNGKKIGTNSVCLKLYDIDIDIDEFHFQSQGSFSPGLQFSNISSIFLEPNISATGDGICISNFTMSGMDNVQISNKLWIEGDQQKCLGQFFYPMKARAKYLKEN